MRKMSLKNRILIYFIIVPLCTFVTAGILTVTDMYELNNFAAQTGSNIVNDAAQESFLLMLQQDRRELDMLAEAQATICQLQMQRVLASINDIETLFVDIYKGEYSTSKEVSDLNLKYLEDLRNRARFSYVNYPAELDDKEVNLGFKTIIKLRNAFKFSCAYDDYYAGMAITFPNGLFYKYDWFPVPLDYDARKTDWFKKGMEAKGKVVWLDPAKSPASNRLLLTCAKAIVIDGEIIAVLMIDVLPTTISNEFVITRGTNCYAFIVSPAGNIVARENLNTKRLIWDLSDNEKAEFRKAFGKIVPGGKGTFSTTFNGDRLDVAYYAMNPGKFVIGVAAPRRKAEEKAGKAMIRIENEKDKYIISASEYIDGKIMLYLGVGILVSLGTLVVAAGVAVRIGKPISQLEAGVKQLSKRKLNERIELKSYDEFQDLGDTFNAMALELGNQIKRLRENIAHQERARHELAVASEIQKAMLPDASLTFPEHDEFDIYAEMHPAREVGGDFYDFFLVDETHLFFAVGDISGKGLSAALFMMRALTLLRHEAEDGLPPDEIFANVGNELYHNNDSCMFFTASCGILDISNGEVIICNAGHPMPYLRHEHSFEPVKMNSGIVVGATPLSKDQFEVKRFVLTKGDTLFLYTDGIIEAFNNKNVEFQSKRLHASLQKLTGANPREVLDGVARNVKEFIDGAPQSDDITMLTVKYYS